MKILALMMLMVVGCGKTELSDVEKLEEENRKLEAELKDGKRKLDAAAKNKKLKEDVVRLSVVGSYEVKFESDSYKLVLLEDGKIEIYENGKKISEHKWQLVGKEIRILGERGMALKIETNGDLTTEDIGGHKEEPYDGGDAARGGASDVNGLEVPKVQTTFHKIK